MILANSLLRLGWAGAWPANAVLIGLPLVTSDFRDFTLMGHFHEACRPSPPPRRDVGGFSSFITASNLGCSRAINSATVDTTVDSVFVIPSVGRAGTADAHTATIGTAQLALPWMSTAQAADTTAILSQQVASPTLLPGPSAVVDAVFRPHIYSDPQPNGSRCKRRENSR